MKDTRTIIIDEEFKFLLPTLDKETYALLEENLIQHGCRDALVLWGDILVDGHNRYEICTKNEIPFSTVQKEFDTREDVLIWIIGTQMARRNLSPMQLSHFRGLHYRADKKLRGNKTGNNQHSEEIRQNGVFPQSTSKRLAEAYNVAPRTIERDAKISKAIDIIGEASPEAKQKILSGELSMRKNELENLATLPKEELTALAHQIDDGTYTKSKPDSDTNHENKSDVGFHKPNGNNAGIKQTIRKQTDTFLNKMENNVDDHNTAGMRKLLRTHIDALEKLYLLI